MKEKIIISVSVLILLNHFLATFYVGENKFFNQTPVAFVWQLSDFQLIIYCSFTTVFKKFEI